MFCVGYTDTLTMSVPLQVLKSLAADFDKYTVTYIRKNIMTSSLITGSWFILWNMV